MRVVSDCEVLSNRAIAPGHFRMRLHGPEIAAAAQAGQFCMIQVAQGFYPFLRRPMCFERIYAEDFSILYKIQREGTVLLAQTPPGRTVSVQGPLGKGFPIDLGSKRHIIVAGGIGVATFPALAEALICAGSAPPEVVIAARNKSLLLCEKEFRGMGGAVYLATDDGSAGEKALAAEMLERLKPGPESTVYACGPMMMMKTTSEVALAAGARCLVSLEARMACGDGVCLGCVVASKLGKESERMVRVCVDGPVFDARIIDWDAHELAYSV
jgi:dihydroorotate dehydrogenase electron transfer subunit